MNKIEIALVALNLLVLIYVRDTNSGLRKIGALYLSELKESKK